MQTPKMWLVVMKKWESNQIKCIVKWGVFNVPRRIVNLHDISFKENGEELVKVEIACTGKIYTFPVVKDKSNRLTHMGEIRHLIEGANRLYCELDNDLIRINTDATDNRTGGNGVSIVEFMFQVSEALKIPPENLRNKESLLKEYQLLLTDYQRILKRKKEIEDELKK